MRRSLVLKKETLVELGPADLGLVAGGALTPQCPTREYGCRVPTDHCVSLVECISLLMDPCLTGTTG
jgi:hypothetical protein